MATNIYEQRERFKIKRKLQSFSLLKETEITPGYGYTLTIYSNSEGVLGEFAFDIRCQKGKITQIDIF